MAEEQVVMEYVSLHGCIRNMCLDAEVHVEHHLRVGRSTWPVEKIIQNHTKLSKTKELGGKQEC